MATVGGMWALAAIRSLRVAVVKSTKLLRSRITNTRTPQGEFQPIPIKSSHTGRQPIHPIALLRQQRRSLRWFSTGPGQTTLNNIRRFTTGPSHTARGPFPKSNTARRVAQFPGRAPFASTLRPNLTGGAIPRSAGGYSIGGNARYFSHTPVAPAQVVNNVSSAMRAFFFAGNRARFDGVDERGFAKYRTISALEDDCFRLINASHQTAPGAFIDFHLTPTITALSSLTATFPFGGLAHTSKKQQSTTVTLNADGLLEELSIDFGRALKDLTTIFSDLKKLAALGDLPINQEKPGLLRVRFPGVDASTVARLCDDIDIQRGVIGEDIDFHISMGIPTALRFPFAPQFEIENTVSSPGGSLRSVDSQELDDIIDGNPWLLDPEGYESVSPSSGRIDDSGEYEGLEGIYKFLEECDRARDRF